MDLFDNDEQLHIKGRVAGGGRGKYVFCHSRQRRFQKV